MLATDSSAEAVGLTAARCAELPQVAVGRIRQPGLPGSADGGFDLIVVAEFAYYLTAADRAGMWRTISAAAAQEAEIVVVHWRHDPHDAHLSGFDVNAEAVRALTSEPGGDGGTSRRSRLRPGRPAARCLVTPMTAAATDGPDEPETHPLSPARPSP